MANYVGKDKASGLEPGALRHECPSDECLISFYGGGQKLLDEFYAGYNVSIAGGNTGTQMGVRFRKEVNDPWRIFEGQFKMRIAGPVARFFGLGQPLQQIAGGDIYPALRRAPSTPQSGLVPYDDEARLLKVRQELLLPLAGGEPGPVIHFVVNSRPNGPNCPSYQEAFQVRRLEANVTMMAEYDHKNPAALSFCQKRRRLQAYSQEILDAAYPRGAFSFMPTKPERILPSKSTLSSISTA